MGACANADVLRRGNSVRTRQNSDHKTLSLPEIGVELGANEGDLCQNPEVTEIENVGIVNVLTLRRRAEGARDSGVEH